MKLIPYIVSHIQNYQWNHTKNQKQEMDIRKTFSCIFVVDTSESMNYPLNNPEINYLNQALKTFPKYINHQEITNLNIDISLIQTNNNNARIVDEFVPISQWKQERLTASGLSPIGHCLETAIRLAEKRMTVSYDRDTPSYPVWIILFTDGMVTDGLRRARELLMEQRLKQEKDYILWLVATENADMKICQNLTNHIIVMNHKKYGSVFQWTSDCFKLLSMHKDTTSNLLEKQYDLITKYKLRKGEQV